MHSGMTLFSTLNGKTTVGSAEKSPTELPITFIEHLKREFKEPIELKRY